MDSLGHEVFTGREKPYNLNIVGVRSASRKVDEFQDTLFVFWPEEKTGWGMRTFPITTLPGSNYLVKNLLSPLGCAILVPGQYKGVYSIDLHGGNYKALCQRNGRVRVFRDKNRDYVYDMSPSSVEGGFFGINIHAPINMRTLGPSAYVAEKVRGASAGCQVFKSTADFQNFMDICNESAKHWGNKFTYTLIQE